MCWLWVLKLILQRILSMHPPRKACGHISIHATLGLMHDVWPSNIRQFRTFWSILDKTGGGYHLLNPLNIVTSSRNFVVVCHVWLSLVFIIHLWPNSCVFALCFCLLSYNSCMSLDHPKVQVYLSTSSYLYNNHNACSISFIQCSIVKLLCAPICSLNISMINNICWSPRHSL